MKLIDFLRTATLEEIVDKIVVDQMLNDEGSGLSCSDWRIVFSPRDSAYFTQFGDCPDECEFFKELDYYCLEEYDLYCTLNKDKGETCPYKVDRCESLKKDIINWFNTEI